MVYTGREKLTIIKLLEKRNYLFFDEIISVLRENPSNVIYVEFQDKLLGIVSMGDVSRECENKQKKIRINKKYTFIYFNEYMDARKIFYNKKNINALPVVDKSGILLGEYTRWDDLFYKRSLETFMMQNKSCLKTIKVVALVRPNMVFERKKIIFEEYKKVINKIGIGIKIIDRKQICDYIEEVDQVLFVDENELRGTMVLYKDLLHKNCDWLKLCTCMKFSYNLTCMSSSMNINQTWEKVKNVSSNILLLDFKQEKEYTKELKERIDNKNRKLGIETKVNGELVSIMKKDFFDEVYDERYENQIFPIPYSVKLKEGYLELTDDNQTFFHVQGGERLTVNQPNEYANCIYMYGPCVILGSYVEDKHTIASWLQLKINEAGFPYKVVNLGAYTPDSLLDLNKILATPIQKEDIIILDKRDMEIDSSLKVNMIKALEKAHVSEKWFVDNLRHCNYKINNFYADAIYNELLPLLKKKVMPIQREIYKKNNYYVENYIERYLGEFDCKKYKSIGAIIMNCNPFTHGHKYLIKEALNVVEHLIIFVVQEDKSMFSFEERFAMVKEGVADLANVTVVPSGEYILSQKTFPEYFMKVVDSDLVKNVEEDIRIFAEKIAPHLHITHRFVGEELQDEVTNEYNKAMQRILPLYGIEFIEIPRKRQQGGANVISASYVRKCLEEGNINILEELIPESTKKILFTVNE